MSGQLWLYSKARIKRLRLDYAFAALLTRSARKGATWRGQAHQTHDHFIRALRYKLTTENFIYFPVVVMAGDVG